MLFANTHKFIHEARRFANNTSQRPDTPQKMISYGYIPIKLAIFGLTAVSTKSTRSHDQVAG